MTRKNYFNALITLTGILVLAVGGFAQNKHGKRGGDGERGNSRGQDMRQQRGNDDRGDRGDRGNNGNGNGNKWGGQKGGDDNQRAYQQQQQRQNEWNSRRQQQQDEWSARQQQRAYQQQGQQQDPQHVWRQQQQRPYQQKYEQQYEDQGGRGRGKHNGWKDDGPRGNAYGLRGIWPGEFRGWRDPEKQQRKAERAFRRSNKGAYYYSDPLSNFYPAYRQPNYGYNNYDARSNNRESLVRTFLSSFFAPETSYNNYYAAPAYNNYTQSYYGYQQAPNYQSAPYYQTQYYSPASYSPAYNQRYDNQSYGSLLGGQQLFGGGGLRSSILSIGLEMLRGFLGQGYSQGLSQGQYARSYGNRSNNYYDPYAASDPAYYSPYASSFTDQRQLLEEGYRLGYQDAMLNNDPYGTAFGGNNTVDLISEFLSNTLLNRI